MVFRQGSYRIYCRQAKNLRHCGEKPGIVVRMGRVELPRVPPLEPKSSASTNSATFAAIVLLQYSANRCESNRKGP